MEAKTVQYGVYAQHWSRNDTPHVVADIKMFNTREQCYEYIRDQIASYDIGWKEPKHEWKN